MTLPDFFSKGDTAPAADGDYIARALHEMEENGADESKVKKSHNLELG